MTVSDDANRQMQKSHNTKEFQPSAQMSLSFYLFFIIPADATVVTYCEVLQAINSHT